MQFICVNMPNDYLDNTFHLTSFTLFPYSGVLLSTQNTFMRLRSAADTTRHLLQYFVSYMSISSAVHTLFLREVAMPIPS